MEMIQMSVSAFLWPVNSNWVTIHYMRAYSTVKGWASIPQYVSEKCSGQLELQIVMLKTANLCRKRALR